MPFKVGEEFRTNELSHQSNSYTVFVKQPSGSVREYDNIKYPHAFMKTVRAKGLTAWHEVTK